MKTMCQATGCDKEVGYRLKFEDHYLSKDNWYEGSYCSKHMKEQLEYCTKIINEDENENEKIIKVINENPSTPQ